MYSVVLTLPETNMETQQGPYKDYSPSKRVLYGFPCQFGGAVRVLGEGIFIAQPGKPWVVDFHNVRICQNYRPFLDPYDTMAPNI